MERMRAKPEHTFASPSASFNSTSFPPSFTGGVGGLQLTPYPLAISNRYASTSSDEGVDNASFFMTFSGNQLSSRKTSVGRANLTLSLTQLSRFSITPKENSRPYLCISISLNRFSSGNQKGRSRKRAGKRFSGTGPPFNSVRGAACMMLQMLSRTRGSGSLILFGRF